MLHVCNDMMLLEISYNTKFPSLLTICFSECFVFNQWWILWQIIVRHFSCILLKDIFVVMLFLKLIECMIWSSFYLCFLGRWWEFLICSDQTLMLQNSSFLKLMPTKLWTVLSSIFVQFFCNVCNLCYTSWLKYNSWDLFLWSCLSCLSGILAVHCFWVNLMSHLTWGSVNDATCISEIFELAWWYHIWLWIPTYVFYVLFLSKIVNVSFQYGVLELWNLEFEKFQMQCLHYILYLDFCKNDGFDL